MTKIVLPSNLSAWTIKSLTSTIPITSSAWELTRLSILAALDRAVGSVSGMDPTSCVAVTVSDNDSP
jgi:hypothetical protein